MRGEVAQNCPPFQARGRMELTMTAEALLHLESRFVADRTAMENALAKLTRINADALLQWQNKFLPDRATIENALAAAARLRWNPVTESHVRTAIDARDLTIVADGQPGVNGEATAHRAVEALLRLVLPALAALMSPLDDPKRREVVQLVATLLALAITIAAWYGVRPPRLP